LLIWLYLEISELFSQSELPLYTLKFSLNHIPFFTDAKLFTCGIFAELVMGKDKKAGYGYINITGFRLYPAMKSTTEN